MCEQFKLPNINSYYRKVNTIITPGTWVARNKSKIHEVFSTQTPEDLVSSVSDSSLSYQTDYDSHQFLASIYEDPEKNSSLCGIAWIDISTGHFYTAISDIKQLQLDLVRIRPREIILNPKNKTLLKTLKDIYPFSHPFSFFDNTRFSSPKSIKDNIGPAITLLNEDHFTGFIKSEIPKEIFREIKYLSDENPIKFQQEYEKTQKLSQKNILELLDNSFKDSPLEYNAARSILNYFVTIQISSFIPLLNPVRYESKNFVKMNSTTINALELVKPIEAAYAGSVNAASFSSGYSFNLNDPTSTLSGQLLYTRTPLGSRLMTERLISPSTVVNEIETRLKIVDFFVKNHSDTYILRKTLVNIKDPERCLQRLTLNKGTALDMMSIAQFLNCLSQIRKILKSALERTILSMGGSLVSKDIEKNFTANINNQKLDENTRTSLRNFLIQMDPIFYIYNNLNPLSKLENRIRETFHITTEQDSSKPRIDINRNLTKTLKALKEKYDLKASEKDLFLLSLKNQYKSSSLKFGFSPSFGPHIEVTSKDVKNLENNPSFKKIHSLKGKSRYFNSSILVLYSEMEDISLKIIAEERRIINELTQQILNDSSIIKKNCDIISEIDVGSTLADLARKRGYVRPNFREKGYDFVNGRHPVVELRLNERGIPFVTNDCHFDDNSRVLLITGPNMGGKSTYLRQVALISIMAQMGSYVPAESANLEIVDSIYSRIGAYDRLSVNQSTFMVEMAETAEILNNATEKSLVIMDEIGRGTSTEDGMSIAYASLKYLHDKIGCKGLFATHFHEITEYFNNEKYEKIKLVNTAILESSKDDGVYFSYIHKIVPGVCSKSFGLYVAQQAGIPQSVLELAKDFTESYKEQQ
ncbi:hypothetical protein BB560_002310 [Smittium megazygosporum]|uniref:DNA mismatch repair protein MSH3 n=1 Tax=Smittium megazygosporum TaxID=133381 RepID=A0A2T9ZF48_9FUNG|nr:hypothetical protein BB560_002310 [Smittium megazygosporum]